MVYIFTLKFQIVKTLVPSVLCRKKTKMPNSQRKGEYLENGIRKKSNLNFIDQHEKLIKKSLVASLNETSPFRPHKKSFLTF